MTIVNPILNLILNLLRKHTKGCNYCTRLLVSQKKVNDLKRIYKTFIQSILEHSSVVWHSGITQKNKEALERVQKAAVKVMMGREYMNYKDALKICKFSQKKRKSSPKIRKKLPKDRKS